MSLWLSPFRTSTSIRQSRKLGKPRLNLQTLEAREVPAQYLVLTAADTTALTAPSAGNGTAGNPFQVETLRLAIQLANASVGRADTIRFDAGLEDATIFLNSGNDPLTFEPGAKTTIDGTNLGITVDGLGFERFERVFNVEAGAKADIKNLTIQNGLDGGFDSPSGGAGADPMFDYGGDTFEGFDSPSSGLSAAPITDFGGGGIYNAGRLTLANVVVTGNRSTSNNGGGGGILNAAGANLILNDSRVEGNTASSFFFGNFLDGGGILNEGTMTIARSTVRDNNASGSGGGIANIGRLTVTASTISGNRTEQFSGYLQSREESSVTGGGGIFNDGTLTMTNATISGNYTSSTGGGVCNGENGSATLRSCTLTENGAGFGGGVFVGFLNTGEFFRLRSTIVSGNSNSGESPDNIATFESEGSSKAPISATFCLIGTSTLGSFSGVNNITEVDDPMLGELQANGGPTLTHLPLSGSPVINKGNNPALQTRDQRGLNFYRVRGGRADIGAVEVQEGSFPGGLLSPPPTSGDDRRYH